MVAFILAEQTPPGGNNLDENNNSVYLCTGARIIKLWHSGYTSRASQYHYATQRLIANSHPT